MTFKLLGTWLAAVLAVTAFCAASGASAADLRRTAGESDAAFAARAFGLAEGAEPQVTAADWNGAPTLFADWLDGEGDTAERRLGGLQRQASGDYRKFAVTVGEPEGGTPIIAAIGFANADRDPAQELIVILAWPVRHYDVDGTLYEVRLFDPPRPGQQDLSLLELSRRFGEGCDCERREEPPTHYQFKTIAAVKAELKRLGYR